MSVTPFSVVRYKPRELLLGFLSGVLMFVLAWRVVASGGGLAIFDPRPIRWVLAVGATAMGVVAMALVMGVLLCRLQVMVALDPNHVLLWKSGWHRLVPGARRRATHAIDLRVATFESDGEEIMVARGVYWWRKGSPGAKGRLKVFTLRDGRTTLVWRVSARAVRGDYRERWAELQARLAAHETD